jgi:putative transposase
MPQSLAAIYVHLIYSTKNREPLIRPEIEEDLRKYHAGILRKLESPMIASDGTADHIKRNITGERRFKTNFGRS